MVGTRSTSARTVLSLAALEPRLVPGFLPPAYYDAGAWPYITAIADLNGDGNSDVVATLNNDNQVAVYLGDGSGALGAPLRFAIGSHPYGLRIADVNGDGIPDLVTANEGDSPGHAGSISVLLGNGDGTFQAPVDYATGTDTEGIAVGDLNGDGVLDLVATNSDYYGYGQNSSLSVLLGNGDGTFQPAMTLPSDMTPVGVEIGDLNSDGFGDIAVSNFDSHSVTVYFGNGDGTFKPRVAYPAYDPWGIALGDLNKDGYPDLVVPEWVQKKVTVLLNRGDGTFDETQLATSSTPLFAAVADVDRDGNADIVTDTGLFLDNGDGTFQPEMTHVKTYGLAVGDLNHDRYADLVGTVTGSAGSVIILLNDAVWSGPAAPEVPGGTGRSEQPLDSAGDLLVRTRAPAAAPAPDSLATGPLDRGGATSAAPALPWRRASADMALFQIFGDCLFSCLPLRSPNQ
jgi:hypothetical protein